MHSIMIRRGILVLFAAAGLSLFARAGILLVSHHYNVAAEANGLYGILELVDGKTLYPPLSDIPFAIYLYPPFHAWVNALVLKTLAITSLRAEVLTIRWVSFFFFSIALILVIRQWKKIISVSNWILACTFAFALPKFFDYITSARHDTLALALEMTALVLFLSWIQRREPFKLVWFILVCMMSVWTRQTGIAVFLSALLWLFFKKEYRTLGVLIGAYAFLNGMVLGLLMKQSHGNFWDHVVLANLRGFRPINLQYFDASLLTFILNYLPFGVLAYLGIKINKTAETENTRFIKYTFAFSTILALMVFQRAGGDINYFFESLLLGSFFVALAVEKYATRPIFLLVLSLHLVAVTGVYYYKTKSAAEIAWLPYEEAAEKMKQRFPPFGLIQGGNLAQSLGIHLRGWAMHGPDVTNAGYVSKNAHPSLRYLMVDMTQKLDRGEIRAYVLADKSCSEDAYLLKGIGEAKMGDREIWYSWLCVYGRKEL